MCLRYAVILHLVVISKLLAIMRMLFCFIAYMKYAAKYSLICKIFSVNKHMLGYTL